ncbi:MAG: CopG family transcriptional regulator [Deltaproteobacteria bacterium]|nr:CopG family transcriptional regulator [Deltaproteobacteria bacterium]
MVKKKHFLKKFESTEEMDRFLETHDLGDYVKKYGKITYPKIKKINLDLPEWFLKELELEASRAGIARQPLIKLWLLQKLDEERKKRGT